jgi:DNA-binding beta-propeller fold protein YncE
MRRCLFLVTPVALALLSACAPNHPAAPPAEAAASGLTTSPASWPGKKPDGSVLLPNQWSLRPVGRQVELGDFPVNVAVHPDGRFAAVLHCGYSEHQIMVVDLAAGQVASRTHVHEAFYGLEFSKDGKKLYCSGAGDEVIHVFDFQDGALTNHHPLKLRDPKLRGVPAGLALDSAGKRLFVANIWGHLVSQVGLGAEPQVSDIVLGAHATLQPAPVKPSADEDTAAAEKRDQVGLYESHANDPFPYACRLDEHRNRLYVSLWSQSEIAVIDLNPGQLTARWRAEEHPSEIALTHSGKRLFVANANRNTVTVFDTQAGKPLETIWAALYPQALSGSTPNSLALSPDEKTLFVANADNNLIAVFDVSVPGKSRSLGFIPVGWYPTSVRVTPDGRQLLVASGKGLSSLPNPLGPQPPSRLPRDPKVQYVARLFPGSLSIIDLPPQKDFARQLATYTAQAYQCSPLNAKGTVSVPRPADNPIPLEPGQSSPIKYCLYIIKENRTYDQVFGDMPEGNGDTNLCLFPEQITPNLHALTRQFVLLDNFYADAEVSADGHEWSMGAHATDFVEKMWPLNYGHNRSGKFPYPSEGYFAVAAPADGYIWDRAREASLSYRSYGEFIDNPLLPLQQVTARVKALEGHIDPWYRGFDLGYSDLKRAERFIAELHRFEKEGDMPRLQIIRLGNDHTHGATPGFRTPSAYVAENDLALGQLVEAVSHSRFWPQTAIFVIEDDAQNGPDHVDAHRTEALVISPYTKHHAVDSSMYSTSSMLRTIELLLGLKPMTQFDAAARPMFNSFQAAPDVLAYTTRPANVDLDARNSAQAWGGQIKMNFAREDAVDDLLLNEVVWRSVRGPTNPMPAPVRAGFVFAHPKDRDDD